MPLLHCTKCHHEYEGQKTTKCDWCGAKGHVLEEKTPIERWIEDMHDNPYWRKYNEPQTRSR